MRIFQCQACDQPVSFESTVCESCERRLGYVCDRHAVSALEPCGEDARGPLFRAYAHPGRKYRLCANAAYEACNWTVSEESDEPYCVTCRHNRVVPDLSLPANLERWRQIEAAKRRLFYSLLRLELPLVTRAQYSDGLAFDFLAESAGPPVMTGHLDGLITLSIAEADDVERERRRTMFGEYYRTLLGHFRHEIGHYFWNLLVRFDPSLPAFRVLFGDERADYGAALRRHHSRGAPPDWQESFVSSYATAHPWEDFAETFAHYLHIVDTLETGSAFEMRLTPKLRGGEGAQASTCIDFDPYETPDFQRVIEAWLPLTYAMNSLNRSMGQPPLYPFKLAPAVIAKLAFVHERIYAARSPGGLSEAASDEMLKAVIAGLRQRVAAPTA